MGCCVFSSESSQCWRLGSHPGGESALTRVGMGERGRGRSCWLRDRHWGLSHTLSPDTPSATPLPALAPRAAQVSISEHRAGSWQLLREPFANGAFTRPLVLGVKIAFIARISIFKRNWWAPGKESGMLSHIWELCFTQSPSNSPWLEGMSDTEPVSKTPTSAGRAGDSAPAAFPCTQRHRDFSPGTAGTARPRTEIAPGSLPPSHPHSGGSSSQCRLRELQPEWVSPCKT